MESVSSRSTIRFAISTAGTRRPTPIGSGLKTSRHPFLEALTSFLFMKDKVDVSWKKMEVHDSLLCHCMSKKNPCALKLMMLE